MVSTLTNQMVRRATVNRSHTPQDALEATGYHLSVDARVVRDMPRGQDQDVEVVFFRIDRSLSDQELEAEYRMRNLVPDPMAQAQVNTDDQYFAKHYPNCTLWCDAEGRWCHLSFSRVFERPLLEAYAGEEDDRSSGWWFGGVRRPA